MSKPTGAYPSLTLDTTGTQIVSQAGATLLTTAAAKTGLHQALSTALARWRHPNAVHDPAKILCDLAIALALGGDCLADIATLRAEPDVFGLVASDPTVSRLIDTLAGDAHKALAALNTARAATRATAWTLAGDHAPDYDISHEHPAIVDLDATLLTAHSDEESAAPTFKRGYGFQCAMRRSVVSPVQPGGTWKEVPGSDDLPRSETVTGTRACQETGGHAETLRVTRQGTRVTRRKLDCLNPNLQRRQRRLHRNDV